MRRLINLMSARRKRTTVIRPESPGTRDAGGTASPYHTERWGILLSARPRVVTCTLAPWVRSKPSVTSMPLSLFFVFRQGRRDHFPGRTEGSQLPLQSMASRASSIAGFQALHRTQLGDQFANQFHAVGGRSHQAFLPVQHGRRHRGGVRVDIQTNESYPGHAANSFRMRSARQLLPNRSVSRTIAIRCWSPCCNQ